jgi:hypothetical protein
VTAVAEAENAAADVAEIAAAVVAGAGVINTSGLAGDGYRLEAEMSCAWLITAASTSPDRAAAQSFGPLIDATVSLMALDFPM